MPPSLWVKPVVTEMTSDEALAAFGGRSSADPSSQSRCDDAPTTTMVSTPGISQSAPPSWTQLVTTPGLSSTATVASPSPPLASPPPPLGMLPALPRLPLGRKADQLSDIALSVCSSDPDGLFFEYTPKQRIPYIVEHSAIKVHGVPFALCLKCYDCPCACRR
mmetsp:Transcript_65409/g.129492  ORF Transcript_65409/g.129492 Transcript_65409/m.129492 type:complete len:163 (-) Transcript_65409:521-1009(-)